MIICKILIDEIYSASLYIQQLDENEYRYRFNKKSQHPVFGNFHSQKNEIIELIKNCIINIQTKYNSIWEELKEKGTYP